ncbi:MAG: nicotinate-nucleotide--dimethylbenzimidazole phosphoribosyltransferase [Thermodesulfobacteriota bacterium]
MQKLKDTLAKIEPLKEELFQKAQERLDNLTKPKGSLGRLEDFAKKYVAITRNLNPKIKSKFIFTFAGDHGIVEEGISAFPKEVTGQMVLNFITGGAGVNVLARHIGAEVVVVDIGVDHDFEPANGLLIRKIARGTKNMSKRPAMTMEEAINAINVGIDIANEYAAGGADIFGTGDMGIGNTTASSAILAAITGEPLSRITGRGTGIDDQTLMRKMGAIEKSISVNNPNPRDPLDVLAKLGGFEIAGIAGLIIGAAANRVPAVVDGFISTAGALIATEINPLIKSYIFASHASAEPGHNIMLDRIGLEPMLDLSLRLGEGTGAALGITLVDAGVKILTEMATFGDVNVEEAIR